MRIGILGGTFDPIHLGHLRAAETVREGLDLDLVAFVPSAVPPHRTGPLSSARDRLVMACLASSGHPRFVTWDTELNREGPSYTVDTLAALRDSHPGDDLVLVVGSDTWPEMTSWKEPERLFGLAEVAVVDRPGEDVVDMVVPYPSARGVRRVEGASLPISATAVRELVRRGRSPQFLVPRAVADYIVKRKLYT